MFYFCFFTTTDIVLNSDLYDDDIILTGLHF